MQAETLRDSFPASDKSLSRLLGEAPYLPKSIFKLLESLCCPGSNDKDDKELHSGDRVTQGLSTIWNLILLRPPIRDVCLKIALQVSFISIFFSFLYVFCFYVLFDICSIEVCFEWCCRFSSFSVSSNLPDVWSKGVEYLVAEN